MMLLNLARAVAFAGVLGLGTLATAEAAIYGIDFETKTATQSLGTAVKVGDGVAVSALIANQPGSFSNTVGITLASNATVDISSAWFSTPAFANTFDLKIVDSLSNVVGDDVFGGVDDGVVHSKLLANLGAGSYSLVATGNILRGAANYDYKVSVTPIPAAAALLGTGLVGLAAFGMRRRKTAA